MAIRGVTASTSALSSRWDAEGIRSGGLETALPAVTITELACGCDWRGDRIEPVASRSDRFFDGLRTVEGTLKRLEVEAADDSKDREDDEDCEEDRSFIACMCAESDSREIGSG